MEMAYNMFINCIHFIFIKLYEMWKVDLGGLDMYREDV